MRFCGNRILTAVPMAVIRPMVIRRSCWKPLSFWLRMTRIRCTALLDTDTEKYKDFVLSEIRGNYKTMLDAGSDTVWETALGESDFDNAGSLCHGWSAVPIYVFHKLRIAK